MSDDETLPIDSPIPRRGDSQSQDPDPKSVKPTPPPLPSPDTASSEKADPTCEVIDRYHLKHEIGRGGFGIVWLAEQVEPVRREVALKVIKAGMDSEEIVARFEAERQTLALMEHPNIAEVLDGGTTREGRPYFVMELVRGSPITNFCDERQYSLRDRIELFLPVCEAIYHAHQKSVLHRDLKPSNILVAEIDGRPVPKVIDFGIAKALDLFPEDGIRAGQTLEGMVLGTPQYMSPEQAGSFPDIDTRSDVYSLGVVLCELLTGETPISPETLNGVPLDEMLRMIRETEIKRPSSRIIDRTEKSESIATARKTHTRRLRSSIQGELDWILLRSLEKERERRYGSAFELTEDLRRFLRNEPVHANPPSARYRIRKFIHRNRIAVGATAAVLAAILGGSFIASFQGIRAIRAEKEVVARERRIAGFLVEAGQHREMVGGDPRKSMFSYLLALERAEPGSVVEAQARTRLASTVEHIGDIFVHDTPLIAATPRGADDADEIMSMAEGPVFAMWRTATRERLPVPRRKPGEKPPKKDLSDFEGERILSRSEKHNLIATQSRDFVTCHLRNYTTAEILHSFKHEEIFSATVSAKSKHWTVTRPVSEIETWKKEMESFRENHRSQPHVSGAELSPDGSRLVTRTNDRDHARIWDTSTGELVFKTPTLRINAARFLPTGEYLITGGEDGAVHFWDPMHGTLLAESEKEPNPIDRIQFSPKGDLFVTNSRAGSARLWDIEKMEPRGPRLPRSTFNMVSEFSPDGEKLYFGTSRNEIEIWRTNEVKKIGSFVRHGGEITGLFVHPNNLPDGYPLISTSSDLTARILPERQLPIDGIQVGDEICSIDFVDGSEGIVIGAEDDFIRVGRKSQDGRKYELKKSYKVGGLIGLLSSDVSKNENFAAFGDVVGEGSIINLKTGESVGTPFEHDQMIHSITYSPDGKRILTGAFDGTAKMWSAENGEFLDWKVEHDSQVYSAAFSPDGKVVATGGGKGFKQHSSFVRFWDADTGKEIRLPNSIQNEAVVLSVQFDPRGEKLIFTSIDNTAKVIDAKTGAQLYFFPHSDKVFCAAVNEAGTLLATGCDDKTVHFWDLQTGVPLGEPNTYSDQVKRLAFVPGEPMIAVGCNDGAVHFTRYPEARLPTHDLKQLRLWIEMRTGLYEDDNGTIQRLSQKEWQKRADRWRKIAPAMTSSGSDS